MRGLMVSITTVCTCVGAFAAPEERQSDWFGFERLDFRIDGRDCLLVLPKRSAEGKPWIWRMEFFGHEPQADLALLEHGFHVAYMDVQNMYGAPVALDHMDAFYDHLTGPWGLSPKVVLEGFSRGGLFAFNWAARHPDRVACIYNDAPVCDFKSWPAGRGRAQAHPEDWERLKQVYGLSEDEALAYTGNPIDNLAPLAEAHIPLLHVCGEADTGVPIEENTRIVEARYRELGGEILVIAKPNCEHHPHSLQDPTRIVNFVLARVPGLPDVPIREPQTPYGYDYFALRDGLANCRTRFVRDRRGRVAFLGGSITAGAGWRDLVCDELRRRFPETEFDFINAGIPSYGSTPDAFRFARDVLRNGPVDLLFAEAAVNDDTNAFPPVEQVRGMEGIVRQARLGNPEMDVVLLHFADPGKVTEILAGRTPEVIASHERVAEHYAVPSINLAREVAERIHAGEFTWEKDFIDLHPSPFGHGVYFRSICRLFDAAWAPPLADGATTAAYALPAEPLDPNSYFRGRLVDIAEAKLGDGWRIDPAWQPADGVDTRIAGVPVLTGETPGATLKLTFAGTAVGLFVAAGPDAGIVESSIDGGPWVQHDLFTPWSGGLHLNWTTMLASDLPDGPHELVLRLAESHNPGSKGTAARISDFLVNGG